MADRPIQHSAVATEAAALNNAQWCAAVWRSHGLPVEQAHGLWFCDRPTPQYYPNVVTVEAAADPADQAAFIAELQRSAAIEDFSVKDSFAKLDLNAAGMKPLFDARWLFRPAQDTAGSDGALQWRTVAGEQSLADWEAAWRGDDHGHRPSRIFMPGLLEDPRALVLAGFDHQDRIRAGGVAYDAAGALGLTNLFGSERAFIWAVASMQPRRDMVCYASGDDHRASESAGFQAMGPLRVWVRAPPGPARPCVEGQAPLL